MPFRIFAAFRVNVRIGAEIQQAAVVGSRNRMMPVCIIIFRRVDAQLEGIVDLFTRMAVIIAVLGKKKINRIWELHAVTSKIIKIFFERASQGSRAVTVHKDQNTLRRVGEL